MRKSKIREWTCDRCGKTFEGNMVFRPHGVSSATICVDFNYNMQYRRKYDFCSECADEFVDRINRYVDQEYFKWQKENMIG